MRVLILILFFIVFVQAAPSSPLIRTEEKKRVDAKQLLSGHSASAHAGSDSDGPSHPDAQVQSGTSPAQTSSASVSTAPTDTSALAQTGSAGCHVRCGLTWGALAALAVTTFMGKGKEFTTTELTNPGDGF